MYLLRNSWKAFLAAKILMLLKRRRKAQESEKLTAGLREILLSKGSFQASLTRIKEFLYKSALLSSKITQKKNVPQMLRLRKLSPRLLLASG